MRHALGAFGMLLVAAAPYAQGPEGPAFPTQAEVITVDVVVVDKDGHAVKGLGKADFSVFEDGRAQTLAGFEARTVAQPAAAAREERRDDGTATNERAASASGRTFAFVLDDLGAEPGHMADGVRALADWLEQKADPSDDVTIVTTSGDAWWSDSMGSGREDLLAILRRVRGRKKQSDTFEGMSDWEAYRIDAFESGAPGADGTDAQGAAALGQAAPNNECIRPSATSPGDLAGRVVDRWMASKACQCEAATADTILESRRSCRGRVAGTARTLRRRMLERAQAVLGAVERLSRGLEGPRGRKSILVLSDGFVRDTELDGFDKAIAASHRGNTAVDFIDLRGLVGSAAFHADQPVAPKEGDLGSVDLEEHLLQTGGTEYVAAATGGSTVRDTNDLFGGLTRVADQSSTYYLLGYQPDHPRDGRWHKLEVRVGRPGLKAHSRAGYFAAGPTAPQAASAAAGQTGAKALKRPLDPAVMAGAVDAAIPVRLAPYVLEPDGPGAARVRLVVEVDTQHLSLEAEGGHKAAVDLTLVGASRDGGKLVTVDERLRFDAGEKNAGGWLTLSRVVSLAPGVALVRVLVRDVASGRAGSVARRFEVPAPNAPYLTTPVLTDRATTPARGVLQLLPLAHRTFRPSGVLYCEYGVEGLAGPQGLATLQVKGGYALQVAGGPVLRVAPATTIAVGLRGEIERTFSLPLADLAPGEYQLVIDVVDESSGLTLTTTEVFSVAPPAT